MSFLVVDASVVGPLFLPDEAGQLLPSVLEALSAGNAVAPQHWRLEVANLARMAARKGRIEDSTLPAIFSRLADFTVEIDSETDRNAWSTTLDISRRHDLTIYDAAYLELSARRALPLATRDRRLMKAGIAEGIRLSES